MKSEFNHPLAPGNWHDVAEKVEQNLARLHAKWVAEKNSSAADTDWRDVPDPLARP